MQISEEQFKQLQKHDTILEKIHNSHRSGGFGLSPTSKRELMSIYKSISGVKVCGSCSSTWLHLLCKWYVEYKNKSV